MGWEIEPKGGGIYGCLNCIFAKCEWESINNKTKCLWSLPLHGVFLDSPLILLHAI